MEGTEFVRSMYDAFNRLRIPRRAHDRRDRGDPRRVRPGVPGPDGFRQFTVGFVEAFPDIEIEPTNIFGEGDQVAAEFRVRGTHSGVLRSPEGDIPATGRTIDYSVAEVWELRDGKVAHLRNYTDSGTLMRQLGLA